MHTYLVFALGLCGIAGCMVSQDSPSGSTPLPAAIPELTEESARAALIELAGPPQQRATSAFERVDDLRAGKAIEFVGPDAEGIAGECWTVCLAQRQFWFIATRGRHTWHLDGKFEWIDGKWQAKVERELRALHAEKE
jgi:hypothetical protein